MSIPESLLGTQLIEILQNLFAPEYDWIFIAITLLGSDAFLTGLGAVIYWCVDKSRGRLVTYILFFGAYVNFFLKVLIPWPRPPIEFRIIETSETSYGFPSGHAQDSSAFWTTVSLSFRKWALTALGVVIVAAVGISRVYLGVHYPAQVIGGWAVGSAIAFAGMLTLRRLPVRTSEARIASRLLFLVGALVPLAFAAGLGGTDGINLGRIGGYLLGFGIGSLAEIRYVRFSVQVNCVRKVFRAAIGGTVAGLLALALTRLLPGAHFIQSFASSLILGLVVALVVPMLLSVIESTWRSDIPEVGSKNAFNG